MRTHAPTHTSLLLPPYTHIKGRKGEEGKGREGACPLPSRRGLGDLGGQKACPWQQLGAHKVAVLLRAMKANAHYSRLATFWNVVQHSPVTDSLAMRCSWNPWGRDTACHPFCPSPAGQLNLPWVLTSLMYPGTVRMHPVFLTLLSLLRNEITTANSSKICITWWKLDLGTSRARAQDWLMRDNGFRRLSW